MRNFSESVGFALVVLALIGPLAYCDIQQADSMASVMRACIEAKGQWEAKRCVFPGPVN